MNRLQQELERLFGASDASMTDTLPGGVRALMLELARPADWSAVMQMAQGVQHDLGLPAPALAVSGLDGFQLWFSIQQAVSADRGMAFLQGLRQRYWPHTDPARLRQWPDLPGAGAAQSATPIPHEVAAGQWSAFVSPGLGAVFADTPWLETCPNPQAQAELLASVQGISMPDFEAALTRLLPATLPGPPLSTLATTPGNHADSQQDARTFLRAVMNDAQHPLRWRIEAARALLQAPERGARI